MDTTVNHRPEDVAAIARNIQDEFGRSIVAINEVYARTHVLSINGRIEAARVGEKGGGFKIVAEEFSKLNAEIAEVANGMERRIRADLQSLMAVSEAMATDVRGQRLSQIGISVMDVVDRNLYERSCDVRWWATDPSVVELLRAPGDEAAEHAARRLGIILDSYTVYLEIVAADAGGTVRANGRPGRYAIRGESAAGAAWFRQALALPNGQAFALEATHADPLVGGATALSYSCVVCAPDGERLGALGIFFNWNGLVQAVFGRLRGQDLREDIEDFRIPTRAWIVDGQGQVLADSDSESFGGRLELACLPDILASAGQGYRKQATEAGTEIVAWGFSPGFETYRSGWYCVLRQLIA